MGDSSGGRDRERERGEWERERELLLLAEAKEVRALYSPPAPLSPLRSEEFDYQQSNITLLKAQLKLVTHERDMLKKDVKRISQERDGAYRHLSLSASPQSSLETSHHRTNSDTVPTIGKAGASSTLSRSHSIASAGDKSLVLTSSRSIEIDKNPDRLMHELQISRKQQSETLKKVDQALKDVEYYRQEAENLRSRYNDGILEKQRLDQEVASLRRFLDEDRKEMAEMRRQQQEILNVEPGGESMSIMYGTLLRKYEAVKDDYGLVSKRYEDLVSSHSSAVAKLEHCQEEVNRYKKLHDDILIERNKFKQQCTQAIRQWDQALRERNEYRDALAKVQRQHEEAVKEINQAMAVRIKASKDIKRLTEERNAAMQEYTMIMSERDSVHKEIEKLQDEVSTTNGRVKQAEAKSKTQEEEKRKLVCQIELLRREIDSALVDRDRALKENHELREKLGEREKSTGGKTVFDFESRKDNLSRLDMDRHKALRDSVSSEHLDSGPGQEGERNSKVETMDEAMQEIEKLGKRCEKLQGDLQDASLEADVAKGRRDWAISERDKVVLERESIRTLCDKLRRERDRAVSELAEALRDLDDVKKNRNEMKKENKELKERVESLEKEGRMRLLQRSLGHTHSRDSAIDTDLQDWETETLDIELSLVGRDEELGLDLAGGRDDPACGGDSPVYISAIHKGSALEGKLKINDCILFVNNLDCRDVDRSTVLNTLRGSGSTVSLVVRRRKAGRRYQATLHLAGRAEHGLTLDTGIYISKINPGSIAARESSIAVGDRVLSINDTSMDHVRSVQDATAILNQAYDILSLTLQKNPTSSSCGPLSSSSSGHMVWEDKYSSPKTLSAATSPIKETLRSGSRELKKLISSGAQTDRHPVLNSSSSSERVYSVNKMGSRESRSPWGQITDTFKEKLDTVVRGRRHSKEHSDRDRHDTSDTSLGSSRRQGEERRRDKEERRNNRYQDQDKEEALAELDSVLSSYQLGSKSSSGKKKRKDRDSFKNGGTWPRARGGPVIEHTTGTILHPHKCKERPRLSQLLTNVPKYPVDSTDSDVKQELELRHEDRYGVRGGGGISSQSYHHLLAAAQKQHHTHTHHHHLSALTPSDTSIDDSVKSGQVGQGDLLRYLTRSSRPTGRGGTHHSDSEHGGDGGGVVGGPLSPVPAEPLFSSPPPPPLSLLPVAAAGTSHYRRGITNDPAQQPLSREYYQPHRSAGFSPYFPSSPSPATVAAAAASNALHHQIVAAASPRYSSPPPPPLIPSATASSRDSILGSPRGAYEDLVGAHSRLYPPLDPPGGAHHHHHQAPISISPTAGLYHHHSPSPSLEMFGGQQQVAGGRLLPSSPYHHHQAAYAGFSGPHHHGGSGSMLLPSSHQQLGYYKLPDEVLSPPNYDYAAPSRSLHYSDPTRIQRIRIPSNPSVGSSSRMALSSSVERALAERCSPSYHVEILSPGRNNNRSSVIGFPSIHKPSPGEIRQIHIDKTCEQLGIKIEEGPAGGQGGVFVSSVSTNSLASQAGLQVGDQLLEVCGINLRMANYDQAAQVLHRVGNSIDIKVQFNPDKFCLEEDTQSDPDEEEEEESSEEDDEDEDKLRTATRSGSPTPRNSPKPVRNNNNNNSGVVAGGLEDQQHQHSSSSPSAASTLRPSSHSSTLTRAQVEAMVAQLTRSPPPPPPVATSGVYREKYHEPRLLYPVMKKSGDLGVRLVGGNAVGIFIHSVDLDSPAYNIGLRSADQILEYNGVNLRQATAEQAAYELAKPADSVALLVQYNPDRYNAIKDQPGDSYYIRAMFDRIPDSGEPFLLHFKKDDILYVDNTMYNGVPGHWSAWLVDEDGQKRTWGIIPSKYKVEEELLLKRPLEMEMEGSRRSSTATRMSFFKRRKSGRSSSREGRELASYSDVASLSADSDGGHCPEEHRISSYVRVEKFDYAMTRPVLIVGPLAEAVVNKLVSDQPHKFVRCQPEYVDSNMAALEKGVMDNIFVDFRRKGSHFECTTVSAIRDISKQGQHCILDIHLGTVERLHHNQIFPIVLLIKFKSVKQIKEVKDPRYNAEKITHKDAKNIYELTVKLETEYKHFISDIIQAGANFMLMCTQIATRIEQEQNKTIWVPTGTIW